MINFTKTCDAPITVKSVLGNILTNALIGATVETLRKKGILGDPEKLDIKDSIKLIIILSIGLVSSIKTVELTRDREHKLKGSIIAVFILGTTLFISDKYIKNHAQLENTEDIEETEILI